MGTPEVVWPDGLKLDVRFERPVACLRVEGEFLCVSEAGALISHEDTAQNCKAITLGGPSSLQRDSLALDGNFVAAAV